MITDDAIQPINKHDVSQGSTTCGQAIFNGHRSSRFYVSILLWFARSIIDLDLYKNTDVVGTLNDLEP